MPNGDGPFPQKSFVSPEAAFGYPRDFLENRFVYLVVSPRAGGLSVGVNMNPVVNCNFVCRYCEVDRKQAARATHLDVDKMTVELIETLSLINEDRLRLRSHYTKLPQELLQLRHVALSGDGEPTLAPNFVEAIQSVVHVRATGRVPYFKIVLMTNATSLDKPAVQSGLRLLTHDDEVWSKLDGGTQEYLNRVNGAKTPIEQILANILMLGRQRPVVIQSLFPAIDGAEPPELEIEEYSRRLKQLKDDGAQIPLVQIYSATRPMARSGCSHLPLKSLSRIARTVRGVAGLRAEVF